MPKKRRWVEVVTGFVLLVTNSGAWVVISKLSDVQFLYNGFQSMKPYMTSSIDAVRNWGWIAGLAMLAHVAYDSLKSKGPSVDLRLPKSVIQANENLVASQQVEIEGLRKVIDELGRGRKKVQVSVGQLEATKAALDEAQRLNDSLRGQLGGMEQAWLTCKREFALYRLVSLAETFARNIAKSRAENRPIADIRVTIRFALYEDLSLATQIESILEKHTGWKVTLDGSNKPTLMPHPEFKVIFDSSTVGTFAALRQFFAEGRLLDGLRDDQIAYRNDPNRFEQEHLIIDVLPTVKSS